MQANYSNSQVKTPPRWNWPRLLLIASALIPVLGLLGSPPDTMLLIYLLFVVALLGRSHLARVVQNIRMPALFKFALLTVCSGLAAECLAWTVHYLARSEQPILLHPQLIPDLILGLGYYSGFALAWISLLRFYRFSLTSLFATTGFFGILVEQNSQVLLNSLQTLLVNPVLSFIMPLYVFAVYGSIMGLPYLALEDELRHSRQGHSWLKYPVALLMLWLGTNFATLLVFLVASWLGLIPEPGPIWERPWF